MLDRRTVAFGLAGLLLYVVGVTIYSLFAYQFAVDAEMERIDRRLLVGVHAVDDILGDDFLLRATTPDAIDVAEDDANIAALSAFTDTAGLAFLYAAAVDDGEVYILASNATADELERGVEVRYFDHYDSASRMLVRAYELGEIQTDTYADDWGRFRGLFLPKRLADGRTVVLGAEIGLESIASLRGMIARRQVIESSLFLALALPLFATVVGTLRRANARLLAESRTSPLTQLPNRRAFAENLDKDLERCDREDSGLGLLVLGLDALKDINTGLGHQVGDAVIAEIAEALRRAVGERGQLYELGGDEYCVVVQGGAESCERLARRMQSAFEDPLYVQSHCFYMNCSVGVALFPKDAGTRVELWKAAGGAMYRAGRSGRNQYRLFDPNQDRVVQEHQQLHSELQLALAQEQLLLHYQPQVDLTARKVIGVEALVRWQHPTKGLLPPAAFIPEIEGTALEVPIGDWIIDSALQQLAAWKQRGLRLTLGVNVGPHQLLSPGFSKRLERALHAYPELAAMDIEIEIVESTALSDFGLATQVIDECRALGVRFALDDFGTGYSSLAYFRTLAIDRLKIDQSFVRDMLHDPGDMQIVQSIIDLSEASGRAVIAEGVETPEHAALLMMLDCRYAQGYGIARPMPPEALPGWVDEWTAESALLGAEVVWNQQDVQLVGAAYGYLYWSDQVIQCIRAEDLAGPDPKCGLTCGFGRWYHGRGVRQYGQRGAYQVVGQLHDRSHRLAEELLTLAQGNGLDEARGRLHELESLRTELLNALVDLTRS
jgi:diguanylate cyclase (GGDEF)-like protein